MQDLDDGGGHPFYIKYGRWKGGGVADFLARGGLRRTATIGNYALLRHDQYKLMIAVADSVVVGGSDDDVTGAVRGAGTSVADIGTLRRLIEQVGEGDVVVGGARAIAGSPGRYAAAIVARCTVLKGEHSGEVEFSLLAACVDDERASALEADWKASLGGDAQVVRKLDTDQIIVSATGRAHELGHVTDQVARAIKGR